VTGDGDTILHTATRKGNAKIVQALMRKGARPDVENVDQKTPLHIAAELGSAKICSILLEGSTTNRKASIGQRKVVNVALHSVK